MVALLSFLFQKFIDGLLCVKRSKENCKLQLFKKEVRDSSYIFRCHGSYILLYLPPLHFQGTLASRLMTVPIIHLPTLPVSGVSLRGDCSGVENIK